MTQPAGICVAPRLAVASRSDTDSSLEAPRNIGAKRKVTLAMNSTRTQEKAQQQTLSIRISEALRDFLERSKHVISSNRGESVSMSEVARILLESAKDDRLDFRLEVAELQQDSTDSLWAIRKKWEMNQALSRAEWIFLAQYIQLACEGISENPEMPRPNAFAVLLKALMAVRRLRA